MLKGKTEHNKKNKEHANQFAQQPRNGSKSPESWVVLLSVEQGF